MRLRPKKSLHEFKERVIERLPSGKLDAYDVYGIPDSYPKKPGLLVCDCCLQKTDRLWCYNHYGFSTHLPGRRRITYEPGQWSFCVYCHALKDDLPVLLARVVTLNDDMDTEALAAAYYMMRGCLHGEPEFWQAGMPR